MKVIEEKKLKKILEYNMFCSFILYMKGQTFATKKAKNYYYYHDIIYFIGSRNISNKDELIKKINDKCEVI